MSESPETIYVDKDADSVACDGGGGALGHPMVWYSFDKSDVVECGYCDRTFIKGDKPKAKKKSKKAA